MIHLAQLLDDKGLPELADRIDQQILTKQCQYCHDIQNPSTGEWSPHHEKITKGNVSHGTCPNCEHILQEELAEMMRTSRKEDRWTGTRQCMRCKKVWDEDTEEWLEYDHLIYDASHGMCPECKDKEIDRIRHKKTAMRPATKDDIYDERPLRGFPGKPIRSIGRTPGGDPILVVPQDVITMQTGDPNSRGTVAQPETSAARPGHMGSMAAELWKTLGIYPQNTVMVADKGNVPWYIRHEQHHIDEFELPQREDPIIDIDSEDPEERAILQKVRYLLRNRETYAYTGTVIDFLINKGFNPPKSFLPEETDRRMRTTEWIRRYISIPSQIIYSTVNALWGQPPDKIARLTKSDFFITTIADRVQEELLVSCVRQFPWIKKHMWLPDGSPAVKTP